jgi:hypothetical protein
MSTRKWSGRGVVWFYLSLPVLYKPRASEAPFRTLVLHPRVPGLTVPQVSLPIHTLVLHPRVPGLTVPQSTGYEPHLNASGHVLYTATISERPQISQRHLLSLQNASKQGTRYTSTSSLPIFLSRGFRHTSSNSYRFHTLSLLPTTRSNFLTEDNGLADYQPPAPKP